eukprot:412512-Ditylum_brightwellii.AAC.1
MLADVNPPAMNRAKTATLSAFVRVSSLGMKAVSADSSNSDIKPDLDQQRESSLAMKAVSADRSNSKVRHDLDQQSHPSAFVRESSLAMKALSADRSNSEIRRDPDQQRKQSTSNYHHHHCPMLPDVIPPDMT